MLEFKPINLDLHAREAIAFRADSYFASFGDADRFWIDNAGGVEYIRKLRERTAQDPYLGMHVWLDGKLIGQMEFSDRGPEIGYVNLYYLIPEMRGLGWGRELDRYAMRYFGERGKSMARLSVSVSNQRAMRFYQRQGWKDAGAWPDTPDVRFMKKHP